MHVNIYRFVAFILISYSTSFGHPHIHTPKYMLNRKLFSQCCPHCRDASVPARRRPPPFAHVSGTPLPLRRRRRRRRRLRQSVVHKSAPCSTIPTSEPRRRQRQRRRRYAVWCAPWWRTAPHLRIRLDLLAAMSLPPPPPSSPAARHAARSKGARQAPSDARMFPSK